VEAICKDAVLHHPNTNWEFVVYTDGSMKGLGACLAQRDPVAKTEYVISFD
jgi:hypothetical protein